MSLEEDNMGPDVVKVKFRSSTAYGVRGDEGYVPVAFAKAWEAKGRLEILGKGKPKKKADTKVEVSDGGEVQVDSLRESAEVESGEDSTLAGSESETTEV